jgi:hypothetical protein
MNNKEDSIISKREKTHDETLHELLDKKVLKDYFKQKKYVYKWEHIYTFIYESNFSTINL